MSSSDNSDASAPGSPAKSGTPSSRANSSAGSSPAAEPKKKAILSDSSDESDAPAVKKTSLLDSDDDDDIVPKEVTTQSSSGGGNLFGELSGSSDSDSDNEKEKEEKKEKKAMLSDSDAESRGSLNDLDGIVMANPDDIIGGNEEEEEEDKEVLHDVELVSGRVQLDFSQDAPYLVMMPNFLSVATHPFDAEHYEEDEDDDQVKLDDEGRNRLKLRVENTIRWRIRKEENGQEIRESNAKIVKWDDGTMSLYLGNEIFEVMLTDLNKNNLPHLYVQQAGLMSAQSVMTHRIKFRPHSTDSKTHRKVTLNMADRSRKNAQVKVMDDVGLNPEITRRENARKEEEAMRKHIRSTQMVRNNFKIRRPNYNGGYSDEEDMMMPSTSKKGRRKEAPIIGASSDSDDEGERPSKKSGGSESDSDEEYRKKKQQQKKQIVTSDEESD